jgi:hypothetical protein
MNAPRSREQRSELAAALIAEGLRDRGARGRENG